MPSAPFADRLTRAILEKRAPLCVALDPVFEHLPRALRGDLRPGEDPAAELAAILAFSREVIRVIAPIVPAVKINIAYFEGYHAAGIAAYDTLIRESAERGLIVIGDIKRGDVGHSAEMYARAHLGEQSRAVLGPVQRRVNSVDRRHETVDRREDTPALINPTSDIPHPPSDIEYSTPDAVTVSGYLGLDGVKPFVDIAAATGRGVFVLVRTSNPSAAAIQDVPLADGRKVHELMAAQVAAWAAESGTRGASGYGCVGAVVATRDAADAARLRALMPESILLVPGYGAQGGRAEDVRPYFRADGTGALVAAGRSVIFAYQQAGDAAGDAWLGPVERACRAAAEDVGRVAFG